MGGSGSGERFPKAGWTGFFTRQHFLGRFIIGKGNIAITRTKGGQLDGKREKASKKAQGTQIQETGLAACLRVFPAPVALR